MKWYLKVLKSYATFSGRARRKEYWMFVLFNVLISTLLLSIAIPLLSPVLIGISGLYSLVLFIPSLAVLVRRLHDTNKSGWYILLNFIPLIGSIWLLVLLLSNGDNGDNNYGSDPKAENAL